MNRFMQQTITSLRNDVAIRILQALYVLDNGNYLHHFFHRLSFDYFRHVTTQLIHKSSSSFYWFIGVSLRNEMQLWETQHEKMKGWFLTFRVIALLNIIFT